MRFSPPPRRAASRLASSCSTIVCIGVLAFHAIYPAILFQPLPQHAIVNLQKVVFTRSSPKGEDSRTHSSPVGRSEEHTSELQSLMRISYAVFCLKKKKKASYNLINTSYDKEVY